VVTSHLLPERKKAAAVLHEKKKHPPEATWPQSNNKTNTNKV